MSVLVKTIKVKRLKDITAVINNNPMPQTTVAPSVKHFGAQTAVVNVWVATASAVARL